jgi:Spy/CpxP family protein refolding chaperone
MAMLDAVGRLDLTDEQRAKLNAVQADLKRRQQELLEKIAAASSKLRMVSHEQALAGQSLSDLRGHLMFANMDAANRAEEMLTKEQRQALVRNSAHVMTPERPH